MAIVPMFILPLAVAVVIDVMVVNFVEPTAFHTATPEICSVINWIEFVQ